MFSRLSDPSRRRARAITLILATALVIAPAAAFAGHQFNDVPNSNIFHDDIDWMRDNGVTRGCNPPTNDEYCPDDTVTREQMAAFMRRLDTQDVFLRPGDVDTSSLVSASEVLPYNIAFDSPGEMTIATSGPLSLVATCSSGDLDGEGDGDDQRLLVEYRSSADGWITADSGLLDASDTDEILDLTNNDSTDAVADETSANGGARSAAGHFLGQDDYHSIATLNHGGSLCSVSGVAMLGAPPA